MTIAKKVFISYARQDVAIAHSLKVCLDSNSGYDCFLDETNISVSTRFRDVIKSALEESCALIVICSKSSKKSQEVMFEVSYAMAKGIPILPVFYGVSKRAKCLPYMEGTQGISYRKRDFCPIIRNALREIEDQLTISETNTSEDTICKKAKDVGLVDISVGWKNIDWPPKFDSLYERLAENSELYLVGRTFMAWSRSAKGFADAVAKKSIRCRMVIADPTLPELRSLVITDQAQGELSFVYNTFRRELPEGFSKAISDGRVSTGFIEIYGIPAYVPSTFSLIALESGEKYCNLEVGIAADPTKRVPMFFQNMGSNDAYTALKNIFLKMVDDKKDRDGTQRVARLLYRVDSSGGKDYYSRI